MATQKETFDLFLDDELIKELYSEKEIQDFDMNKNNHELLIDTIRILIRDYKYDLAGGNKSNVKKQIQKLFNQ